MMRATVCIEAASGLSVSLLVIGSRYCGGLATPLAPAGSHCACQHGLRLDGAIDHHLRYSLREEVGLVGGQDRAERIGSRLLPEQRLRETGDGNRPCRRHVELERSLPGQKERNARSRDAGEHRIRVDDSWPRWHRQRRRPSPRARRCRGSRRWPAMPPSDRSARTASRAAARSWPESASWSAGATSVPVLATMAARPALNKILHPAERGIQREGAAALRSVQT